MRVKTQLFTGNGIILVAFIIVSVISVFSIKSLITNSQWVSHTYEVIGAANEILGHIVDQETGVRGYMATGDKEFLDPYYAGKRKFASDVILAKQLVIDNPEAVAHFNKIQSLATEWQLKVLNRYIKFRQDVNSGEFAHQALLNYIASGEGRRRMDAFRQHWQVVISATSGRAKDACWALLADMGKMETGVRGYLVTGDEEYLKPFYMGELLFEKRFSVIGRDEVPGLDRLRTLATDWVNLAGKKTITLKRYALEYPSAEDVKDLMGQKLGKKYVDQIREEVAAIISGEERLLVERERSAQKTADQTILSSTVGAAISVLIVIGVMILVVRNISRPIVADMEFAKAIADGDLNASIDVHRNDELGDLANALNRMARKLRDIDWLKQGKEGLDDELRGEHGVDEFLKRFLTYFTKHLGAQVSAYYQLEGDTLTLVESHAFSDRHGVYNTYKLGEGMVGQAAIDNETVIVSNIKDAAPMINYGAAEVSPGAYMTVPVSMEGEVFGVLLLGTIDEFTENQKLFVEQNVENVAVLLNTAQSRQTIQVLFDEAQRSREEVEKANAELQDQAEALRQSEEELQAQQEELRVTNEELEEQAKALKSSEEELQAQQEELRVANEELEQHIQALEKNDETT